MNIKALTVLLLFLLSIFPTSNCNGFSLRDPCREIHNLHRSQRAAYGREHRERCRYGKGRSPGCNARKGGPPHDLLSAPKQLNSSIHPKRPSCWPACPHPDESLGLRQGEAQQSSWALASAFARVPRLGFRRRHGHDVEYGDLTFCGRLLLGGVTTWATVRLPGHSC